MFAVLDENMKSFCPRYVIFVLMAIIALFAIALLYQMLPVEILDLSREMYGFAVHHSMFGGYMDVFSGPLFEMKESADETDAEDEMFVLGNSNFEEECANWEVIS